MSKLIIIFITSCLVVVTYGQRVTPAPIDCNSNEVYLPQGEAPNCDTVCSELGQKCTKTYFWAPFGCYCITGFARDEKNVCIPISQCPKENVQETVPTVPDINEAKPCKRNEVWMDEGKNCDTVCSELGETCYTNWFLPPSGCYCADEFARDADDICIPIKDCPPKTTSDGLVTELELTD